MFLAHVSSKHLICAHPRHTLVPVRVHCCCSSNFESGSHGKGRFFSVLWTHRIGKAKLLEGSLVYPISHLRAVVVNTLSDGVLNFVKLQLFIPTCQLLRWAEDEDDYCWLWHTVEDSLFTSSPLSLWSSSTHSALTRGVPFWTRSWNPLN